MSDRQATIAATDGLFGWMVQTPAGTLYRGTEATAHRAERMAQQVRDAWEASKARIDDARQVALPLVDAIA